MGRNGIPKIGEWRDGVLFELVGTGPGQQTIFRKKTKDKTQILAVFWNDGFTESVVASYFDGYAKGKIDGYLEAKKEIRRALGISEEPTP